MKRCTALIIAAAFALPGCTMQLMNYSALSSKPVEISGERTASPVSGEDCVPIILFFPFGQPSYQDATTEALNQAGAGYNVLIDGQMKLKWWSALVYGQNCVVVEGTGVRATSGR